MTNRLLNWFKEPLDKINGRLEADLATGRERPLTTGKPAERTKHDFRCSICRSAIGQLFDLRAL